MQWSSPLDTAYDAALTPGAHDDVFDDEDADCGMDAIAVGELLPPAAARAPSRDSGYEDADTSGRPSTAECPSLDIGLVRVTSMPSCDATPFGRGSPGIAGLSLGLSPQRSTTDSAATAMIASAAGPCSAPTPGSAGGVHVCVTSPRWRTGCCSRGVVSSGAGSPASPADLPFPSGGAGGASPGLPRPPPLVGALDHAANFSASSQFPTAESASESVLCGSAIITARPLGHGRFGSVSAVRVDELISFDLGMTDSPQADDAVDSASTAPDEVAVKVVSLAAEPRAAATELAFAERALEAAAARADGGAGLWAHVAEVLEAAVDTDAAELRLTLELLPGGPVASLPEFGPVARRAAEACTPARREARLQRVARDVLAGLAALHGELRVLHRDIKPANVLLAADGSAKLADLGCCAVLPEGGGDSATDQQGSLAFMAPERLRGDAHSFASDVWGLGVTLLQLALGGAHPFLPARTPGDGASRFWALAEVLRHTSDDVAEREAATAAAVADAAARSGLSPAFVSFCAACLASEPERRAAVAELRRHAWLAAPVRCD